MTDQTTETRVAEIEKRAVDALGIGAFGKAVLVCRSDIPWLTDQLRAAWKREAALLDSIKQAGLIADAIDRAISEDQNEWTAANRRKALDRIAKIARTALQETPNER